MASISSPASQYVFGYGSLAAGELAPATLADCVRVWDVAMDNAVTVAGYKFYVDPRTGERPAVYVTFLNITDAPGAECVGCLVPVESDAALAALDRRERNYERIEVTNQVLRDGRPVGATTWAYRGTPAARVRYAEAAAAGTAVIQRAYLASVEAAFGDRGLGDAYRASTRAPACPVRDLRRVDVPSGAAT